MLLLKKNQKIRCTDMLLLKLKCRSINQRSVVSNYKSNFCEFFLPITKYLTIKSIYISKIIKKSSCQVPNRN